MQLLLLYPNPFKLRRGVLQRVTAVLPVRPDASLENLSKRRDGVVVIMAGDLAAELRCPSLQAPLVTSSKRSFQSSGQDNSILRRHHRR